MREEDYKNILEDEVTKRPSNCKALVPVECNAQILEALKTEARKADFRLKEVSKDVIKAATIIVKSLMVLDKVAQEEGNSVLANEVGMINGALALFGNANYRNNLTRRFINHYQEGNQPEICPLMHRQGSHDSIFVWG
ncbi:hypothetical protein Pcinc_001666 [Petrolisthes cinctipes]|uniref:Uncharacterized protein n=1 Tax=Petrolisthes cinctipes TaxID=88211 RepID=A0AAE1KFD9_PETCI|nr:hypothetical protein Pcinc_024868 [Petrolisthes cinctipes]KAK3873801.1 hypothetical protein Pcinc_021226 [Petrolisthes cinctipes]KAK3894574.1 hypothetical protein Pcinc_001666 [Petrolisthes cinctipes]